MPTVGADGRAELLVEDELSSALWAGHRVMKPGWSRGETPDIPG